MPVEIKNLCKSFGEKKVLDNLNMRLEDGGIYCLMGSSGMGKTTLLRIIMNLETKDSGSITGFDPEKEISAMFQEDRILPFLNAVMNVNMMYEKKRPTKEIREDLEQILPKKCLNQPVCELSGGMKRRVSLARTMHFQGKMIILDEPFTGLDSDTRQKVIQYILKNRRGRILLVATHGEDDAAMLGAQTIRLEECQNIEAQRLEKEKAAQRRQMHLHQFTEMVKDLPDEQMERMMEHVSEMMEMEKIKNRNLYPLIKKMQMQESDIAIMQDIPKEEWHPILSMLDGWEQHYDTGEVLWNVGDTVKDLPIILEGSVEACTVHGKARESLISRFSEGHCFGEMLAVRGVPSPVRVCACEPTTVMYIPADQLKATGYDKKDDIRVQLLWKLLQEMAGKINIITEKLEMTGGRLSKMVLDYLNGLPEGSDGYKKLEGKKKDMASYLNIPPQSLARTMAKLRDEGVISRNEKGNIKVLIPDWEETEEQENEGK